MNKHGILIILSGPSGSGKGTIVRQLLNERDDTILSISATTRAPRKGEEEGIHYYFKTKDEFKKLIKQGAFLEYAVYNGHYYGTLEEPIRRLLNEGKNVILEIEVQGAEKVMDHRSDLVSIFITIPSMGELKRRLHDRGTETKETIEMRLEIAKRELSRAFRYDYVVLNDEVPLAVERIQTIINAEEMRYFRMENYILEVVNNA
ncbi:MAG TPA: guanylate kinase [Ruminococcaceae bacterium]|nr:guanylate kinase [Oscillospiraceae bacterium]HCA30410.1 guanylate kinase [Oscillospiraceae bacterium]